MGIWNYFDVALIVIDIVEVVLAFGIKSNENHIAIFRIIRVLRVIRSFRVLRMFRLFARLRLMVVALFNTGESLVWAMLLFAMVVYMFGLYFCTIELHERVGMGAESEQKINEMFGTLSRAMYTLFLVVSNGRSWGEISDILFEYGRVHVIVFFAYIFFTIYAMTNVITATFVEDAVSSAQKDQQDMSLATLGARRETFRRLHAIFEEGDANSDGALSYEELKQHLSKPVVRAALESNGVTWKEALSIFKLLDRGRDNRLDIDLYLFSLANAMGNARSIDLSLHMYETRRMLKRIHRDLTEFGANEPSRSVSFRRTIARNSTHAGIGSGYTMDFMNSDMSCYSIRPCLSDCSNVDDPPVAHICL